ncbi:MAG: AHH domain-containing protein [Methylococcaceae bacterium]
MGNVNYPSDWVAHHVIPIQQVKNSVVMKAASDLAGYNINRKSNLIMLPKDANAAIKVFDGKPNNASSLPEHRGGHNQGREVGNNYQNYVRDRLAELDSKYKKALDSRKPWSPERLLAEMKKFENSIKNDLLTGKTPALCSNCKGGGL